MSRPLHDTRAAVRSGAPQVPARHAGSALPLWPALPGRRQPDLDRVAGHLREELDVRAAIVSLLSAAGQVIPGAGGRWGGGRSLPHPWPFCSEVVRTGRPLLVDDVRTWRAPAGVSGPVVPWLGAYAGVPLTDESGRVVGAVSALADRSRPWLPGDVVLLEETAALCRDLVRLRAAQIALEQCVAEATWGRGQARAAADRSETELVRARAEYGRQQMVSAVADTLAQVAGTATDAAEICAVVETVLARHVGPVTVRWALAAEDPTGLPMRRLSSTSDPGAPPVGEVGPSSVCLPVISQVTVPGSLVLRWPGRRELQAEDRDALSRIAALVGQALDRMRLVRRWEGAARDVVQHL